MSAQPSHGAPWWRRGWLWLGLFLLVVACTNLIPQQGWNPAAGPVVPHDSFPADCSMCHTGGNWHTLKAEFQFDHAKETGVPLEGAHAQVGCLKCHNDRGPVAQFAVRGCAGCHADVHQGRLGVACKDCHNERTWQPRDAIVRHDQTRFPLVGAHAATACFRCHPGAQVGNFAGADSDCYSCHAQQFASTTDPNHTVLGYSHECQKCHLPFSFQPARFDHPGNFPLTDGHGGLQCKQCHTTPNTFTGLSTDCASCHTPDFMATSTPNHSAAGFSTDCSQCHTTRTFHQANWSHPDSFPLSQGHSGRQCAECHQNNVFAGTPTDCQSCHLDTYQATTSPAHAAAGLGTDCATCHTPAHWSGGQFNHPASMPLTNAHNQQCTACHTTPGVYSGLSPSCVSCHQTDYNGTTNPNHVTGGFSTNCQECHGTAAWQPASFTHPSSFPLTNSHNRACSACHTTPGVYTGLSTACVSCHQNDFNGATNPNHVTGGFSTNCVQCHGTSAWQPASFTHPSSFPLTNSHNRACTACHTTPGVYTGLSTTCVSCHLSDYQATTNPPHVSFQMSQQCQDCHNTTSWGTGNWNHPFPINSGHHHVSCFTCHNNPANRLLFSCIDCHEHRQSSMNSHHQGVQNYQWVSTACYQCHPNGH